MKDKVTILAMTEKGYAVLKAILPKYRDSVEMVVAASDAQIQKDFYLEIKDLCRCHSINFIDKKSFISASTKYVLAISWRWIINVDKNILIVFHDSLLPRYRGFNPLVSALINGEAEIGVTALLATSEYDKGDIINQSKIHIDYPIKIQEAILKIIESYQEIALQIMTYIVNEKFFSAAPQNEADATYSLWRDEDDYRINWDKTSTDLKRFVDAVGYPYKGASTMLNSSLVRILDVEVMSDVVIENRTPGKIIFVLENHPVVVCGQGLLKIMNMIDDYTKESLIPLKKFRARFL